MVSQIRVKILLKIKYKILKKKLKKELKTKIQMNYFIVFGIVSKDQIFSLVMETL